MSAKNRRAPLSERFWKKVAKGDGCWLWTASKDQRGYGQFITDWRGRWVKNTKAHRVAWMLARGPIPNGKGVLHRCDNPACVNPDHLFIGTHAENMRDMVKKGRQQRGERSGRAKLTWAIVAEIRASTLTSVALAARFGVHHNHIGRIRRGLIWRTVG